jgi:protein-S-isoprenylcysteine O-methyltransferase Ste14
MRLLELRIPPPIVALTVAGGMWLVARSAPVLQVPHTVRLAAAIALAVLGAAVALAGVLSFRRARTTLNPLKPETSAALVTGGVYSFTRNPMYLGMLLALIGWAAYLSSSWSLLGPVLFVMYIARFQIVPEEKALDQLFGASFAEYRRRVRRWI